MNKIILSLGGSIIVPEEIDVDFLQRFRAVILARMAEMQCIIFTGGGKVCRKYQDAAKEIADVTDEDLDWIGIYASRLNAQFVQRVFRGYVNDELIIDPTVTIAMEKPITVGAGWKPGHSTDFDAVQSAVLYGVKRVVNLSNIASVYDTDPKKYPDAQKIGDITWVDFQKLVGTTWSPGLNTPFDPIASQLAAEHGIEVVIADGRNLPNLEAILDDKPFEGTLIHS